MSRYQQFIYQDYQFDKDSKILNLTYSYDNKLVFHEQFYFNFEFIKDINYDLLDLAFQSLFIMAGVSYYKMYLAPEIILNKVKLDQLSADFFSRTFEQGLGEFFYINHLPINKKINFPVDKSFTLKKPPIINLQGVLVAIGGGKDSILSVEILKKSANISTWNLGHNTQLQPLTTFVGLDNLSVERHIDPSITKYNDIDAYNGHIPISAIFATVGVVIALLSGKAEIIVSNEHSASEPTLVYNNQPVNHQYSKSLGFEIDFQKYLKHVFGNSINYYSILRPLNELRIAELFSPYFDQYRPYFSSCNRAFTQDSDHLYWCGECAKCAFTFLIFTPFIEQDNLVNLWGRNLLLDHKLDKTYAQLLGIAGDKPLDCVGEIRECRAAMRLAQRTYPSLAKYQFDLPDDYDWRQLHSHSMPQTTYETLLDFLDQS